MADKYYDIRRNGDKNELIIKVTGKSLVKYLGDDDFFNKSGAKLNENNELVLNDGYNSIKISEKIAEQRKRLWDITHQGGYLKK